MCAADTLGRMLQNHREVLMEEIKRLQIMYGKEEVGKSKRPQIEFKGQQEIQNLKGGDNQEIYKGIVMFKSKKRDIETETDDEENKRRQSRSESTTANSARASQYSTNYSARFTNSSSRSTNSSSRASLTPSIFSEPLTERGSTNSWMSSHRLDIVEPLQQFDLVEAKEYSPQFITDSHTVFSDAEMESHNDSTPNFQTECKYWCTVCHTRCLRKDIWQLHEARCYWPEAQYSCPYCDRIFDSESHFRFHHSDKHASSPCVVRCADKRTRTAGWGCGFCAAYLDRWGERCNHVGDHFETGSRGLVWKYSNVIRGLLRQPELARHWQDLLVEKHGPNPESRLTILFSEPETGRPDPDLQDILEFRRPEYDLEDIVRLAYGLGVRPHLNDAVDVTAAETECASKLSNLVLSGADEIGSARYVTCYIKLYQFWPC
jgi:hypothetical protein